MQHDFEDPADDAVDDSFRETLYASEEQENAYREAAKRLLPAIVGMLNYIREGKRGDNDMRFRLAVACHYFQHPAYAGKSMAEICDMFGKTRAAGSTQLLRLQRKQHLVELVGQKSKETRATYYTERKSQIQEIK